MTTLGAKSTPTSPDDVVGGRIGRAAVRLCMAALVLAALEVSWLLGGSYDLGALHLVVVIASAATLMLAVSSLVWLAACLSKGLGRTRWSWVFALLTVPMVVPIVQSLFSGGAISKVSGVFFIKIAFGAALVVGVRIAAPMYQRLCGSVGGIVLTVLVAAIVVALSYVDAHFQVGLYPAAHTLMTAALLAATSLLCSRVVRTPSSTLKWSAAVGLLGTVAFGVVSWQWAETKGLVTYSNGLMPKYRRVAVAVRAVLTPTAAPTTVVSTVADSAREFLFVPTTGPEVERVRAQTRNVIFILVDALRNDHVGPQADGTSLTPAMDALQRDGLRFANCYSPSDHTGRSMPSLMTSLPVELVDWSVEQKAPLKTWIQQLDSLGFRTFANGLADHVSKRRPDVLAGFCFGTRKQGTLSSRSSSFVDEIIEFATADPDRPFAVYTHWMEAHITKASKMASRVYRGGVRLADKRLERLVSELRRVGLYDNTMIVLTADHGYSLGEQNRFLGSQGCVERAVRVPLIVRLPGLTQVGLTVEQNTSGHEVCPTILDCLAPEVPSVVWSRSLLAVLWDPADSRRANKHVVFSSKRDPRMIRQGRLKYIQSSEQDTALVFDVVADPEELSPINDHVVEARLAAELRSHFERQDRLVRAMLASYRSELAPDVVARLSQTEYQAADVAAVLVGFWEHNQATRRHIVKSLCRGKVAPDLQTLDALARDSWEEDDQVFLITRAHFGCDGAAAELTKRFGEISVPARRHLVDTIPQATLPHASLIAAELVPDLVRMWQQQPVAGSIEEEIVLLGTHHLAGILGKATPHALRKMIAELHGYYQLKPNRKNGSLALLGERPESQLLIGLLRCVDAQDLDLVRSIAVTHASLRIIVRAVRRIATPEAKSFLLEVLARQEVARVPVALAMPFLKKFKDADFRKQASEVIQSRFPDLEPFK